MNWLYPVLDSMYHHNTSRFFSPDWELVKEKFTCFAGAVEALLTLDLRPEYAPRAVREFRKAAGGIL